MTTEDGRKKEEKRKMGLILQQPYEVLPGVVSYPLRVEEIRGRARNPQADQSFVQLLMKRLVRETRQIQR